MKFKLGAHGLVVVFLFVLYTHTHGYHVTCRYTHAHPRPLL